MVETETLPKGTQPEGATSEQFTNLILNKVSARHRMDKDNWNSHARFNASQ